MYALAHLQHLLWTTKRHHAHLKPLGLRCNGRFPFNVPPDVVFAVFLPANVHRPTIADAMKIAAWSPGISD